MDVEAEQCAGAALQEMGERLAALQPQPMGGAVSLQGVVALEPHQRIEVAGAGGIAVGHRHDVGARGEPDGGIGGEGLVKGLADERGRHLGRAGKTRQVIAERALELGLAEDGGVQQPRQHRLGRGGSLGGLADPGPDGIDRPQISRSGLGRVLELYAIHGALLRSASVPSACGAIDTPPGGKLMPAALQAQFAPFGGGGF